MIEQLLDLPLYRIVLPTPFPVGPVNVYLSTEPEPVLLDTGPATADGLGLLEARLAEAGLRVEDLRKIVVSHGHMDHYGLAAELASRSGAPVYAPPLDDAHFRNREQLDEFYDFMMRQAGVPQALADTIETQFRQLRSLAEPLDEYVPLDELGGLRCGDLCFQPVATPGHTPGSVSFHDASRGVVLAADTVLKHITPNPILDRDPVSPRLRFGALSAYLGSLDRIRALSPEVIYTGHGDRVDDFAALHDRLLAHHRKRQQLILNCLRTREHTVYQVGVCLFPEARTYDSFLAVSEVYAHLDVLEDEGQVRKRFEGAVAVYSA